MFKSFDKNLISSHFKNIEKNLEIPFELTKSQKEREESSSYYEKLKFFFLN